MVARSVRPTQSSNQCCEIRSDSFVVTDMIVMRVVKKWLSLADSWRTPPTDPKTAASKIKETCEAGISEASQGRVMLFGSCIWCQVAALDDGENASWHS